MTCREDVKTDVLGCWPVEDFYFRAGISVLSEQLKTNVKSQCFFYTNLNRHTLRAFIRDFSGITSNNIIIICSRRLLPLAYFWLKESRRVRAVFDSGVSVESIAQVLNNLQPGDEVMFPASRQLRRLTYQDMFLLRHYIEQGEVVSLQAKLACSCSTVYRRKMMAARKFGVRKIEHLFSLR